MIGKSGFPNLNRAVITKPFNQIINIISYLPARPDPDFWPLSLAIQVSHPARRKQSTSEFADF
jgi:hypothetical protein